MTGIVPETLRVVMERIARRAQAAADRWSPTDLEAPHIDHAAVDAAMRRYLAAHGEPVKPLRWFPDGTAARAYSRARVAREPRPAYWPSIAIARALDLAWFAGAMRPPIEIGINRIVADRDWENWVYAVSDLNAAVVRDPSLPMPVALEPLDDDFPAPPGAGTPIDAHWLAVIRGDSAPPARAVHPERLWTPLIDAFAAGLYFFWNGADEVVCIPRPALWLAAGKLHRDAGPAVLWPSGERHFFKHGAEVLPANAAS